MKIIHSAKLNRIIYRIANNGLLITNASERSAENVFSINMSEGDFIARKDSNGFFREDKTGIQRRDIDRTLDKYLLKTEGGDELEFRAMSLNEAIQMWEEVDNGRHYWTLWIKAGREFLIGNWS